MQIQFEAQVWRGVPGPCGPLGGLEVPGDLDSLETRPTCVT